MSDAIEPAGTWKTDAELDKERGKGSSRKPAKDSKEVKSDGGS